MSRGHDCVLNNSAVCFNLFGERKWWLDSVCIVLIAKRFPCLYFYLEKFLDILTVENVFRFSVLKLTYQWHKSELPDVFHDFFLRYASSVHAYNTRYAVKNNLQKLRVRTNVGNRLDSCNFWSMAKNPWKCQKLILCKITNKVKAAFAVESVLIVVI